MGNAESAKKKKQIITASQPRGEPSEERKQIHTKSVLLLHKSSTAQLKIVRNFRDALTAKTDGTVHVTDFVNIANKHEIPHTQAWLDELHNAVLFCLTSEAIEQFRTIILERGFADPNGHLHPKVFSVSFGERLDSEWPPRGLKKGSKDLRDFHFGFSDVEKLRPQDFERSLRLNSLVAAIKATS